jgi:hypothetical protein
MSNDFPKGDGGQFRTNTRTLDWQKRALVENEFSILIKSRPKMLMRFDVDHA